MSSNVGLTTPRGSGTSGYIQRNLSTLKPRDTGFGAPYPPRNSNLSSNSNSTSDSPSYPQQRQPDQDILAHDRQREIEIKVFELRDRLEEAAAEGAAEQNGTAAEEAMTEEEIERRCDELRQELRAEMERERRGGGGGGAGGGKARGLKPHQVHELAEAKLVESERLRRALGIGQGREGRAWEDGNGNGKGDRGDQSRRKGGGERGPDGGRDRERAKESSRRE